MGRIEALTRALHSLRKVSQKILAHMCLAYYSNSLSLMQVGIRTRTESEDEDVFGKWSGLDPADKRIGNSKATVYASLAGRNRASEGRILAVTRWSRSLLQRLFNWLHLCGEAG